MPNIYYETLSEIRQVLEKKYNEPVSLPSISYETLQRIRGENFFANIYRMPSGRYELVDYPLW